MGFRVLLADDHLIVRQGLRGLLEKAGHTVVAEASDGRAALEFAKSLVPDVAVLDLSMPLLNGLDLTREILRADPRIKPVLLTMHADRVYVIRALRIGTKGYILKTQAAEDLIRAIDAVMNGQIYISPGIADAVVGAALGRADPVTAEPLSPREREILQLVAEGKTSKEIARILSISPKTAESHRYSIMSKLDIHDVAGLVRYAIREGILQINHIAED